MHISVTNLIPTHYSVKNLKANRSYELFICRQIGQASFQVANEAYLMSTQCWVIVWTTLGICQPNKHLLFLLAFRFVRSYYILTNPNAYKKQC